MLQRLTEDVEYAKLLDDAAKFEDSTEQLTYVTAFTISAFSTTVNRTTKPFNPLLGETYECDRSEDLGWKSVAEQVYNSGFFFVNSGAKIRPHSQRSLGAFFPNFENKIPIFKKKIFFFF